MVFEWYWFSGNSKQVTITFPSILVPILWKIHIEVWIFCIVSVLSLSLNYHHNKNYSTQVSQREQKQSFWGVQIWTHIYEVMLWTRPWSSCSGTHQRPGEIQVYVCIIFIFYNYNHEIQAIRQFIFLMQSS